MSQLSLLFKERILNVYFLKKEGNFVVGNIPESTIYIDSLAVLPQHAQIRYEDPNYVIEPLNNEAKILINGKLVKFEEPLALSNADKIGIGKHTLLFLFDEVEKEKVEIEEVIISILPNNGWIQYLSGSKMGDVLHITADESEISDISQDNIINIVSQTDGYYYASLVKGKAILKTNKTAITQEPTRLEDDSDILLGSQEVLFYLS